MIQQCELVLTEFSKGFHLITRQVESCLQKKLGGLPAAGLAHLFIQHTSAGLCVNENADPAVRSDLDSDFDRMVPESRKFLHEDEGPDDMPAHVKSVLVGSSVSVPISGHRLNLGTWQGIYLCEFRSQPHTRRVIITVMS